MEPTPPRPVTTSMRPSCAACPLKASHYVVPVAALVFDFRYRSAVSIVCS
jgi:hypothetical protein